MKMDKHRCGDFCTLGYGFDSCDLCIFAVVISIKLLRSLKIAAEIDSDSIPVIEIVAIVSSRCDRH